MLDATGSVLIEEAIRKAKGPAICAYLMAGYPTLEVFPEVLVRVSRVANLVEIGVPFSDPMADGQTIQHAAYAALANGTTLDRIFDVLEEVGPDLEAPHLLMGYYNPFLVHGLGASAERLVSTRTAGVIVPDLPPEESQPFEQALDGSGVGMIRLVTPATPQDRLRRIGQITEGFLYAVTMTGVTGGDVVTPPELVSYLDRARAATDRPVLAGFGVRERSQVAALAPHIDGVVVGTALIETLDRGVNPIPWLAALRP